MENFFKLIISQLTSFWKGMDSASRRKLITAGIIFLVAIVGVSYLATKTDYVVLYSNLDSKEAGEILNKLGEMKADAKPESNGTILVPRADEAKLRMQLSAEGYPKNGFSSSSAATNAMGLGATDYDKRRAEQLQLQDRLQAAIMTMDGIDNAIVTISIPEQDSFVLKDDKKEATASVLLKNHSDLSKKQITGIEELVAKSVLGLKKENISIVDTNMNPLNSQASSDVGAVNSHFEMEKEMRDTLQKQVLGLLEPVFGKGNVIPSVNVHLNFDKQVTETVKFEPVLDDTGIAVSINELKEKVNNNGTTTTTTTTTTTASPSATGQTQYPATADGSSQGGYEKTSKTINYEVNQIKQQIEKAQGSIDALTLSVIINKTQLDDQALANIQKIVSSSVGVDESKVIVKSMAFDGRTVATEEIKKADEQIKKNLMYQRYFEIGKYVLFALIILFALIGFIKAINKIKLAPREIVASPQVQKASAVFMEEVLEMPEEDKEQLMKKKKIDSLIDSKPDVAAQQIRDWLNES